MKQIVDFEQAKRLKDAGIHKCNRYWYWQKYGDSDIKKGKTCTGYPRNPKGGWNWIPMFTIGELIECLDGHSNDNWGHTLETISAFAEHYPELIDALGSLAIKIKEHKHVTTRS